MNLNPDFDFTGNLIDGLQAFTAIYSVLLVILVCRRILQKPSAASQEFPTENRQQAKVSHFDEAAQICDSSARWNVVAPQLILIAPNIRTLLTVKKLRLGSCRG